MCLLKKITYGEFFEFVQEKKITYKVHTYNFTAMYIMEKLSVPIDEWCAAP